jgi:cysteine-rich repeat protein
MRFHLLAVLAGLSLVQCSFDGTGLTGGNASSPTNDTTGDESSTGEPTSSSSDPTVGAVCGNYMKEPGEECDNGEENNGGGALCKDDCTLNTCGDGYLAPAIEGCDDSNNVDGDGCTATCTIEGCGDGEKAGMEECDDGNNVDGDGCSNFCRLPICGDGIVNGGDECDDPMGNTETGSCVPGCKLAMCGDGFVHEDVEACDDGNAVDGDSCSNSCAAASCGDGVVQMGEDCDLGDDNSETGACLPSCKSAACGDNFIQADVETCDDGNVVDGDGCSDVCETEECGNGIDDPMEECDDGNDVDDDDCRNTCVPAECGDMIVAVNATEPETCDDGNTDDTDNCPGNCQTATCGDGFLLAGEECDDKGVSDTCDAECKRSAYWVFVTSSKSNGAGVMNLAAADAICNTLAEKNNILAGVYKAWLSDGNMSASERLFHSPVRYMLPNKAKVADSWDDLTDGNLDLAIARDETGTPISINPPPSACNSGNAKDAAVWTGTVASGDDSMLTCMNWTVGDATEGQAGMLNRVDDKWSNCQFSCDTQARLYCIEQPAP